MRENEPGTHGRYPTDSQSDSSQSPPTKKSNHSWHPGPPKTLTKLKVTVSNVQRRWQNTLGHLERK